jgi:hypothetical protein
MLPQGPFQGRAPVLRGSIWLDCSTGPAEVSKNFTHAVGKKKQTMSAPAAFHRKAVDPHR